MNGLKQMTLEEKIEYLRQNPIFWSRLGFEKETGGWHLHVEHAKRHKTFFEKGIVVLYYFVMLSIYVSVLFAFCISYILTLL